MWRLTYRSSWPVILSVVLALSVLAFAVPRGALAAPANDNFANATPIGALPFSDTADTTGATLEPGEPPPPCPFGPSPDTVWYVYRPTTDGSVSLSFTAHAQVAAYSGTALTSLTSLGCRAIVGTLTIQARVGQSYYFQIGGIFGSSARVTFSLAVTPPPQANFAYSPVDPSAFDSIHFFDISSDPGGVGFQSWAWTFGDGSSATGCCPDHRYARDGDYTVGLTVTTTDGRTGSVSQPIRVRTHDVGITKFTVPQSARPGQTREITVSIRNDRYPETVEVLFRKRFTDGPFGGFLEVGRLTQSVPVTQGNRTTSFTFNYTFTAEDAALGKVTFQAIVNLVGARDAIPADNTVIALPATVR